MTPTSTRSRPQGPSGSHRRTAGFTLIELMIAVAVIGILASIAYPSYIQYVEKSRVADGKAAITEFSHRLERCFSNSYDYKQCADDINSAYEDGIFSENGSYEIVIDKEEFPESGYLVQAKNPPQSVGGCDLLTLNHKGERGGSDGCW